MSDEHKLYRDVDRAGRAERLMADEMLNEALEELRKTILHGWVNSGIADSDLRENYWKEYRLIEKFKAHLSKVAMDGKLAVHELNMRYGKKAA